MHEVHITRGHLAMLAGKTTVKVNSVHHQSVRRPGIGLRITAKSPDGVIEAVEWTQGPGWALGVQWHPERTPDDPLARQLFRRLVFEAAIARIARQNPPKRHTTRATGNRLNKKSKSGRSK
jgi:putative glutamine amidotransferase